MRYAHKSTDSFYTLLSYMREATFLQFTVAGHLKPNVIEYFVKCKFYRLTALSLNQNNIESIEALAFLDMPHLRTLFLH